jgi:hypothetical protein
MIIEIKVHPMSKRILEAEYGAQPIQIGRHDLLFAYLCFSPLQDRLNYQRADVILSDKILIEVGKNFGYHIYKQAHLIGINLFRIHKDQMCRHAAFAVQQGKGVRPALLSWLEMHGIEEDHYGLDTAYKAWQRFRWKIEEKNTEFSIHFSHMAGVKVYKKKRADIPLILEQDLIEIELKLSNFIACLNEQLKVRKLFNGHARCYFYVVIGGMSFRKAAELLSVHFTSVRYGVTVVQAWAAKNRMVAHCLAQISDLPEK